jgi:hypothetical protein
MPVRTSASAGSLPGRCETRARTIRGL